MVLLVVEQGARRNSTNRRIEQFNHVKGGHGLQAAAAQAIHQLQQATGVGREYSFCLGGEKVLHLAVAKLGSGVGFEQIVDSGGSTTERALRNFGDFEIGDAGKQL